jgi:hypothetical protein
VIIWMNLPGYKPAAQAYYSDDDGATFFADDVQKIYPFDHNGKQAYRAYVYECPGNPRFVSYLARYSDSTKAKMTELAAKSGDADAAAELARLRDGGVEVRKPNQAKWVPLFGREGEAISGHPRCSDGKVAKNVWP